MRKLLFIVCFWSIGISFAQEKQTALDKLMAKEWCFEFPDHTIIGIKDFNRENIIITIVIEKGQSTSVQKLYHLSDTPEPVFDRSKVGKVEQGSYIIEFDEETKETGVYRIIVLTDRIFTLQYLSNPDMQPAPVTYEAREKP